MAALGSSGQGSLVIEVEQASLPPIELLCMLALALALAYADTEQFRPTHSFGLLRNITKP